MLATTRQHELRRHGLLLHAAGASVVFVLVVVFYFAVYSPILASRRQIDENVSVNQERLDAAANTREQHASLNDRLRESEELAELVRRRIPQQPQTPQFLGAITAMAEDQDMVIRNFAVGEVFERETHFEVGVKFATSGDYESVCRFLDQLLSMPRVVAFEQLTLDGETAAETHQIQLSLLLPFGIKSGPAKEEQADG